MNFDECVDSWRRVDNNNFIFDPLNILNWLPKLIHNMNNIRYDLPIAFKDLQDNTISVTDRLNNARYTEFINISNSIFQKIQQLLIANLTDFEHFLVHRRNNIIYFLPFINGITNYSEQTKRGYAIKLSLDSNLDIEMLNISFFDIYFPFHFPNVVLSLTYRYQHINNYLTYKTIKNTLEIYSSVKIYFVMIEDTIQYIGLYASGVQLPTQQHYDLVNSQNNWVKAYLFEFPNNDFNNLLDVLFFNSNNSILHFIDSIIPGFSGIYKNQIISLKSSESIQYLFNSGISFRFIFTKAQIFNTNNLEKDINIPIFERNDHKIYVNLIDYINSLDSTHRHPKIDVNKFPCLEINLPEINGKIEELNY